MLNSFMNTVHLKCQWVNVVGGQLEMEIHAFYLEMKVHNSQKQLLKFIIIAHKRDWRVAVDHWENLSGMYS